MGLLLFATTGAIHAARGQQVDAYVIFGQSNAAGRSNASELTDASLAQPYSENIHYTFRERNHATGETVIDLALGALQPHGINMIGPELTLGRQLAQNSSNPVMLTTFASGGTGVSNFQPEASNLYQPMLDFLLQREAEILGQGYSIVKWKGLFVVTGEADSGASHPLFRDRLLSVREALAIDLDTPVLPMVYAQLKGNWVDTSASDYSNLNAGANFINAAMLSLADDDPTLAVTVSNADLDTRFTAGLSTTDGIHYSADAYAQIGNRLYDAFAAIPPVPEPGCLGLLAIPGWLITRRP